MSPIQVTVVCLVDPGAFRPLHAFLQSSCGGAGRLDVLSLAATEDVPAGALQQQSQPEPSVPSQPDGRSAADGRASPSSRYNAELLCSGSSLKGTASTTSTSVGIVDCHLLQAIRTAL